jgi:hypothetical protein
MNEALKIAIGVLGILLAAALVDIARLTIQKAIWNRRHRRMIAELKRRADKKANEGALYIG